MTGEDYNVEAGEGARPFRAFLDVGIQTTSTGAKVFGFLKVRQRSVKTASTPELIKGVCYAQGTG